MIFNREILYNEFPPKKNLENQNILKETIHTSPEGEEIIKDKLSNPQNFTNHSLKEGSDMKKKP
jgi:hypothetical protein